MVESGDAAAGWLDRVAWGPVFVVLIVLTAGALVADVVIQRETRTHALSIATNATAERVIYVEKVSADPGDVAATFVPRTPATFVGDYDFYVVPRGDWILFRFEDTEPEIILHHETGPPDIPFDPEGDPPMRIIRVEPLRIQVPEEPGLRGEHGVDFVWVFEYAREVPTDPEARELFVELARASMGRGFPPAWITPVWVQQAHLGLVAAASVLTLASLAAGLLWARGLWRRDEPAPAGGTEGLVRLVELGGAYLRYQRALFIGLAVPLVYVVWVTMEALRGWVARSIGLSPGWSTPTIALAWIVWGMLVASWLIYLVRVHRDLRAWEEVTAEPPLDL